MRREAASDERPPHDACVSDGCARTMGERFPWGDHLNAGMARGSRERRKRAGACARALPPPPPPPPPHL